MLALLLSRAGDLVHREEIRDRLWGVETHIEYDQAINTCIREVRRALRDDASDPLYIRTVAGEGYRFVAPVERIGAEPTSCDMSTAKRDEPARPEASEGTAERRRHTGRQMRRAGGWLTAAVVVAVLCALGWAAVRARVERSTLRVSAEQPSVRALLGAFVNRTGDPVLDKSLETAFRIGAEQYRNIRFVPSGEVRNTLLRMKRDPDEPLDRTLLVEVALRSDADVLITGETFRVGGDYLLTVELLDPETGTEHAFREQVSSKDRLLRAIDRLIDSVSTRLRAREGGDQVEPRFPLVQVTTSNLEALKSYSLAHQEVDRGCGDPAISLFEHAVELDPNFAMAHVRLATILGKRGEIDRAWHHFDRARESAKRLSAYELHYVEALLATKQPVPERAMDVWARMTRLFPERRVHHYNLAIVKKIFHRDFESCAAAFSRALELDDQGNLGALSRVYRAGCLQGLGDDHGAVADVEAMLTLPELSTPSRIEAAYRFAALGRRREAEQLIAEVTKERSSLPTSPLDDVSIGILLTRATFALEEGRPDRLLLWLRETADAARDQGKVKNELHARIYLLSLLTAIEPRNSAESDLTEQTGRRLTALLARKERLSASLRVRATAVVGTLLARRGFIEQARILRLRCDEVRSGMRDPGVWQGYLDLLDAELALRQGNPRKAVSLIEGASAKPPGPPYHGQDTLRRAYLALADPASAERHRQWMVRHRGWAFAEHLGAGLPVDYIANVLAYHRAARARD